MFFEPRIAGNEIKLAHEVAKLVRDYTNEELSLFLSLLRTARPVKALDVSLGRQHLRALLRTFLTLLQRKTDIEERNDQRSVDRPRVGRMLEAQEDEWHRCGTEDDSSQKQSCKETGIKTLSSCV